MLRIKIIYLFTFITCCNVSFAQLKKANEHYNNFEYIEAIKLYKKVIEKNDNTEALEKLAHSYLKIKDYQAAEKYYALLVNKTDVSPVCYYNYGLVLKNNNKVDEAKEQFKIYLSKVPDDKQGQIALKSCDEIKIWLLKSGQYSVNKIQNINSIHSDFSPVLLGNKMVFVSERSKDMVNNKTYSWNKQAYLNLYHVQFNKLNDSVVTFSDKVRQFAYPINTQYHDGPVSFNSEQNQMFITRVKAITDSNDSIDILKPQLYISQKKGSSWTVPKPFKYNNPKYSYAHASVSADGKYLFFVSDMPGGIGGMDIYVCQKEVDDWGIPQNIGKEVNTNKDEVFPFIKNDGTLFFSSDGHSGFGGLDIFSSKKIGNKFSEVTNLGSPLNSATDDFGIIFNQDNKTGFFSTNRLGGKGSDDIYSFVLLKNYITIQGRLLFNKNVNDPIKNADILLLNEDGKVLKFATTDENGYFKFDNLDPELKYLVKLDNDDPEYAGKRKMYMTDEAGKFVRVTVNNKGDKFVFKNLPLDENRMSLLGENDDVNLAGNILIGENPSVPLENAKVTLVNQRGVVVQATNTNALGAFVFNELPSDENFTVKLEESVVDLPPGTKITITNKNGKEVYTTKVDANKKFNFYILAEDQNKMSLMVVDDVQLKFDFKGRLISDKDLPIINIKVDLINQSGASIQSVFTGKNGEITFNNIDYNIETLITIDETDSLLKVHKKIYLTDENGKTIKEFVRANGKFRLTILPEEKNKMGYIYVDDPWLKVIQLKNDEKKQEFTIIENIYYDYDDYKILPDAKLVLDKVVNIMKNDKNVVIELSSHTDSRSTAQYNLTLSQKRAEAAVAYMISKGADKKRISGKGFGESKPINKCADGVECTETEHAKNRRTEFNIKRK